MQDRLFGAVRWDTLRGLQRAWLTRQLHEDPTLPGRLGRAGLKTADVEAYAMVRHGWIRPDQGRGIPKHPGHGIPKNTRVKMLDAVVRRYRDGWRHEPGWGRTSSRRTRNLLLKTFDTYSTRLRREAHRLAQLEQRIRAEGVEIDWTTSPPAFRPSARLA